MGISVVGVDLVFKIFNNDEQPLHDDLPSPFQPVRHVRHSLQFTERPHQLFFMPN